eukprot:TRINITY_DN2646_c0_g1_i2.p1 TRINITY_DN2646_c0_g1~~TRINITY_DN2646_c0_g1_i2.p1  ORF type:complete len:150 (+),score=31.92 TRINITY_DN2646_c0_g1_i2:30-479(+)
MPLIKLNELSHLSAALTTTLRKKSSFLTKVAGVTGSHLTRQSAKLEEAVKERRTGPAGRAESLRLRAEAEAVKDQKARHEIIRAWAKEPGAILPDIFATEEEFIEYYFDEMYEHRRAEGRGNRAQTVATLSAMYQERARTVPKMREIVI